MKDQVMTKVELIFFITVICIAKVYKLFDIYK